MGYDIQTFVNHLSMSGVQRRLDRSGGSLRVVNVGGPLKLAVNGAVNSATASDGRCGPDPMTADQQYGEFA
jgi:hypothetical protein